MDSLHTFLFFLFTIIAILFGLVVHEFGHFIFAKIFKVNVKEFSIGIGPKVFSKKYNRTVFCLRPFLVMAYVIIDNQKLIDVYKSMAEDQKKEIEEFREKNKNKMSDFWIKLKYDRLLKNYEKYLYMSSVDKTKVIIDDVSWWKQFIIYFGGIFFNILFFLLFFIIIQFGMDPLINKINSIYSEKLGYDYQLDTNVFNQLGNVFKNIGKNMIFYNAWGEGSQSTGTIVGDIITINKIQPPSEFISYSLVNYFCIFNLVLAVFNILPIPPLDGFKIMSSLISMNGKIKISKKIELITTYIGIGLMAYIFLSGVIADIMLK